MKIYETSMSISEAVIYFDGCQWATFVCRDGSCFHSYFITRESLKEFYDFACTNLCGVKMLKISDNQFD